MFMTHMGWTQQQITQRVKEKAFSESESIYGTLYGTLGDVAAEDMWVWLSLEGCGCTVQNNCWVFAFYTQFNMKVTQN